jgi:multidrug efflux pump subunit AcrA (membrane-fusion protein)
MELIRSMAPDFRRSPFVRGRLSWSLVFLGLAVLGGVILRGARPSVSGAARNDSGHANERGAAPAVPVAVATASRADVPVRLSALGSVVAFNSVTVRPRVDGQLMRVMFREGQFVRSGDLLAEIDPRPFEVQLQQAEGQLARDQAQLANAGSTSPATRRCSTRTRSHDRTSMRRRRPSRSCRPQSRSMKRPLRMPAPIFPIHRSTAR